MKYQNIREEELKNKVAQDYFWLYDCSKIIGNVDFCVCMYESPKDAFEQESLLWAEAKKGSSDIYKSIVQLILTIGKARTFDKFLPPSMLGALDGEKIAFIPYNDIHEVFYINDFNWNVTPSNHDTKEFKLIHKKVKTIIDNKALLFDFLNDDRELKKFIKKNFIVGKFGLTKTKIDKNNFMVIYNKWLQVVKPTIAVNWDIAKKTGIIDGDFYLADLLSHENTTLKEKLFVLLRHDHYELDRKLDEAGMFSSKRTDFTDKQVAHTQFWNKYDRPPKEEYWDYIVERRDLLVPQDVRERKGSFFTPQKWVELSQKYLTDVLGEDWQDEYYVWDCAAGTGNLLAGLTNKYNIWASTLDNQDVEVMRDRIKNGANLLDSHVFQFDFLNDDFSKLPKPLQDIINNPKKRKKLVMYINPPYAEAGDAKQRTGTGKNKTSVSHNRMHDKYHRQLSGANRELFAQFLARIYFEIPDCKIANFSKLKILQSAYFSDFRSFFKASLKKIFLVAADTFDNVKGQFPIAFFIWNTEDKQIFTSIVADIYNKNGDFSGNKEIISYDNCEYFSKWINSIKLKSGFHLAWLQGVTRNDFQNQNGITIRNKKEEIAVPRGIDIYDKNLAESCVCYAVRMSIDATWLNDRDQFLFPNNNWQMDSEFKNDCLIFTIFHDKNTISSKYGINHWIPFTEQEVNAGDKFESDFMSRFIQGKITTEGNEDLFSSQTQRKKPLKFSPEAKAVLDAGRKLWKYYHQQPYCNVNASLYDIREHFQGRNESGKMNNKSADEKYMKLIGDLREKLKELAEKIEPKVYEYEFLKE
ncbi:MAG TPA: hypothetical protein PLW09_11180 [Candidatus Kapabacteria bacterium]|nr:hypothetical protein [Candidatus Kapabacteria bacterium]